MDDKLFEGRKARSIPRDDVAELCVACLAAPEARNRAIDVITLPPGEVRAWRRRRRRRRCRRASSRRPPALALSAGACSTAAGAGAPPLPPLPQGTITADFRALLSEMRDNCDYSINSQW